MTTRKRTKTSDGLKKGCLVELKTFFMQDRRGGRDLVERTVLANPARLICVLPGNYGYGYGDEHVVSMSTTTIRYHNEIPAGEWVELHFDDGVFLDMYDTDFQEAFGRKPPRRTN